MRPVDPAPMQPPALIRCDIRDGDQCITWAHKFRPDHQPTPEAKEAR